MKLSIEQINELITGCKLAVELKPTEPELRHFMTVWGYEISADYFSDPELLMPEWSCDNLI